MNEEVKASLERENQNIESELQQPSLFTPQNLDAS
jgi:hypothetical protein